MSPGATTSSVGALAFSYRFAAGEKASFSSNIFMRDAGCKTSSAIPVPGGALGAPPPPPSIAARLKAGGGFLTVTLKYFAVVAGTAMVCCSTLPAGM